MEYFQEFSIFVFHSRPNSFLTKKFCWPCNFDQFFLNQKIITKVVFWPRNFSEPRNPGGLIFGFSYCLFNFKTTISISLINLIRYLGTSAAANLALLVTGRVAKRRTRASSATPTPSATATPKSASAKTDSSETGEIISELTPPFPIAKFDNFGPSTHCSIQG